MSYDDGAFPLWLIEGTDTTGDDGVFPIWIGPALIPLEEAYNLIIWVSTEGNDILGNGRQFTPYRTIERALLDFKNGCQIRIITGTYTPPDTILINNLEGSIFAETPGTVIIQPRRTTQYGAVVAIINSSRFTIQGVHIRQSTETISATGVPSPLPNTVGIYANNVQNFTAYSCTVSDFACSGECSGIWAAGTGRIENCTIEDMSVVNANLYGIYGDGINIIDNTVRRLTNRGNSSASGVYVIDDYTPPGP